MKFFPITSPSGRATILVSKFEGRRSGDEFHIVVKDGVASDIDDALSDIGDAYDHALKTLGLSFCTAVFRRLFVSDFVNQRDAIEASRLAKGPEEEGPVCLSAVEQPPLPHNRVSLWAYHIGDCDTADKQKTDTGLAVRRSDVTHVWSAGMVDIDEGSRGSSFKQTEKIFSDCEQQLASLNGTPADDVIRTWIYVQNVDVNYAGMVKARRELFEKWGLSKDTHYIASTGIEGRWSDPRCFVLMDAYGAVGLDKEQVRFLTAPESLGPTSDYGVTFERATAVEYADRRHIFISGTASIDPQGNTLHVRDVRGQTIRALENVEALLRDGQASFEDMAHLIVYLRDPADLEVVSACLKDRLPAIPLVFVHAPVCRPQWLVELEGVAVVAADNPHTKRF